MRRFRNVYPSSQDAKQSHRYIEPCYGVMNVYALELMIMESSNSINCHPMCYVNPPYAMFPVWMVEPTTFLESKSMV